MYLTLEGLVLRVNKLASTATALGIRRAGDTAVCAELTLGRKARVRKRIDGYYFVTIQLI